MAELAPPCSIYVGDLDPSVNERDLYNAFSVIGNVVSIRVCRDFATRASLGYGYVNFQNHEEALRAINTMNFQPINGKPCRVTWIQRDPSTRRSGLGNIVVKGLDPSVDSASLCDHFSRFGDVVSCKVPTYPNGASKCYGFVQFSSPQVAEEVVRTTNGKNIGESVVTVEHYVRHTDADAEHKFTNVFVKNFPTDWNEDNLKEVFSPFGEITSVYMPLEDGKSKGFACVNFEGPDDAKSAIDSLHEKHIVGKDEEGNDITLYVQKAMNKAERLSLLRREQVQHRSETTSEYNGCNLYINHLRHTVTEDILREHFQRFGNIVNVRIMKDRNGNTKGFGFLCFDSPIAAEKAKEEMHNRELEGMILHVDIARSREERQAYKTSQLRYAPNPQSMYRSMSYPQYYSPMMVSPSMSPQAFYYGGYAQGQVNYNVPQVPHQFAYLHPQDAQTIDISSQLAGLSPEYQKQYLGNILFSIVSKNYQSEAGKITGMLLDLSVSELLQLIYNQNALEIKVNEVLRLLEGHIKRASSVN